MVGAGRSKREKESDRSNAFNLGQSLAVSQDKAKEDVVSRKSGFMMKALSLGSFSSHSSSKPEASSSQDGDPGA